MKEEKDTDKVSIEDKASQTCLNPSPKTIVRACREDPLTQTSVCEQLGLVPKSHDDIGVEVAYSSGNNTNHSDHDRSIEIPIAASQ